MADRAVGCSLGTASFSGTAQCPQRESDLAELQDIWREGVDRPIHCDAP